MQREGRIKPGRDEKILTSWNGLMISGFVDGFKLTQKREYLKSAEEAVHFILGGVQKQGRLMRVFNKGRWRVNGYAEDYAFFIQALIDLYEATFEMRYLKEANHLNEKMMDQFWDDKNGGFFFTGKENESLIARSKSPYDNAIPSANSIAVSNLVRLGHLTGDDSLKQKAEQILQLFHHFFMEHPSGFAQMLSGFSFFLNPEEVGIVGSKDDQRTKSMLKAIYQAYLPNKILSLKDPQAPLEGNWFPFLREKEISSTPTTFICKGFTCLPPVQNEKELGKIIG